MDYSTEPEAVHFTDVLSPFANTLLEVIEERCQHTAKMLCRFPYEAAAKARHSFCWLTA